MPDIFSDADQTPEGTPDPNAAGTPSETPPQVATDTAAPTSTQTPAPTPEPNAPATPAQPEPTVEELKKQLDKAKADAAHWQTAHQKRVEKERLDKLRRSMNAATPKPETSDEEYDGKLSTLQAKIAEGVTEALRYRDLSDALAKTSEEIVNTAKDHEVADEELNGVFEILHRFRLDKDVVVKDADGLDQVLKPTSIDENKRIHQLVIRGMAAERAIEKAKTAAYQEGWAARDKQLGKAPVATAPATPDQSALTPEQAAEKAKWDAVMGVGEPKGIFG